MAENIDDLHRQIKELEGKVAYLNAQLKQENRFGLQWIDVPEAFDAESENKIPILEEVPELAIPSDDGKPTHILIEGDNYHALTCLNYTHHGKVDVIYIDPPYNTGSDGFTYKDKRFLDKFPDGAKLPANHPLRHSAWLSFMKKRLEKALPLLSDKGTIFISIDDNELTNLKLLCDSIFGGDNYLGIIPRVTKKGGKDHSEFLASNHDYILIYAKSRSKCEFNGIESNEDGFKGSDEFENTRGKYKLNQTLDYDSLWYNPAMDFPLTIDGEVYYPGGDEQSFLDRHKGVHNPKDWVWRWSKQKFEFGLNNGFIVIKKGKGRKRIYTKTYLKASIEKKGNNYYIEYKDRETKMSSLALVENEYSNDNAKKEIASIIGGNSFDFPKPTILTNTLIQRVKNAKVVLDFFAGSGTTLHSCLQLNSNNKKYQCIIINSNENNICRNITYKRNVAVIKGYKTKDSVCVPPLGNSLKYYRTSFVGSNASGQATDEDKTILAQKAGCLLALAENTLYEQKTTDNYQIFKDKDKDVWTAVYFKEDVRPKFFNEFVDEVKELKGQKNVYIFSWGDVGAFESYFDDDSHVHIKGIPQPILDIYKSLNS